MTDLKITRINQSFDKIDCDFSLTQNLKDYFSYILPNAKFTPMGKMGLWDGRIRLFDSKRHLLPAGLRPALLKYCYEYEYTFEQDVLNTNEVHMEDLIEWGKTLNLPKHFDVQHYQYQAIIEAEKNRRNLFLSATSSGKTLIAYLLFRWFKPKKLLFIVPRISLVTQLLTDFEEYGYNQNNNNITPELNQSEIYATNWQSIFRKPKEFFQQFDMVIGDEAHNFQAKSLSYILESCVNADLRFGLTGSLSGSKTHEMVLRSHFGEIVKLSDTKTLMDSGRIAKLYINIVILKHKPEDRKYLAQTDNKDYPIEIDFLEKCKSRNRFLTNLLIMQQKNSFCLFKHIEHGELLHKMISEKENKQLFYVAGSGSMKSSIEDIEKIRKSIEKTKESITLASLLAFSEGTNIKNINDVIFASPSKSRIKVMQSIGRGLRKSDIKTKCTLWDIADDLSHKRRKNHTLKHLFERIKYYDEEGFVYKIFEIDL